MVRATNVASAPSASDSGLNGESADPAGVDLVILPSSEVGEYWPLVVTIAGGGSRRVIRALVATVVPCESSVVSARSTRAAAMPSRIARIGSSGVEATLATVTPAVSSSSTSTSVNVPPTSTATRSRATGSRAVVDDGDGLARLHAVLALDQELDQRAGDLGVDVLEVLHDLHQADGVAARHLSAGLDERVAAGIGAPIERARHRGQNLMPHVSSFSLAATARASSAAPGVSECTQTVSARIGISFPDTDTATPSRMTRSGRAVASAGS